jgi:hypothetical protein
MTASATTPTVPHAATIENVKQGAYKGFYRQATRRTVKDRKGVR